MWIMKKMVKTELWKATHNTYFYLALAAGLVIVLIDLVENFVTVQGITERTLALLDTGAFSGGHDGISLFVLSLPYNGMNYASRLYLFVWPILAGMPFTWSYCAERRSGLYNQIVSRNSVDSYFVAKYIAVFVSGGLAVSLPLLSDVLLNAMICPYETPDVVMSQVSIFNGWFLSGLYYTIPWAHALIWCVVAFFLGGAVAGLCFLVGTRLRLQVLVVLVPFAILMLWDVLYNNVVYAYFWEYLPSVELSPLLLVLACGSQNPVWLVATVVVTLTAVGFGAGYWQVKRNELV